MNNFIMFCYKILCYDSFFPFEAIVRNKRLNVTKNVIFKSKREPFIGFRSEHEIR